ncbi:MAG: hypothetical protein ACFCU6_15050 [Balneolaceae bacterium]
MTCYPVKEMIIWEESMRLLDEIIDDPKRMDFLFINIMPRTGL